MNNEKIKKLKIQIGLLLNFSLIKNPIPVKNEVIM